MSLSQTINTNALNHVAQKHSESGLALLKAASLPYENFCQVANPDRVPAPCPVAETQLSDCIVSDFTNSSQANLTGYIEYYPELSKPLCYTSGTTYQALELSGKISWQQSAGPQGATMCSYLQAQATNASETILASQYGEGVTARIALGNPALSNYTVYVNSPDQTPGYIRLYISAESAAGVWSASLTGNFALVRNGGTTSAVGVFPAGTKAIRFEVQNMSDQPYGTLNVSLSCSTHLETKGHWSNMVCYDWPFLTSIPDVQLMRRIAAAILVTYTGSQLQNGGQIASGLVPTDWNPPTDDPFTSVGSLRNDRYDGPVRDGTDVTWRPLELYDTIPQNRQGMLPVSSKMVIGFKLESGASVRIRAFGMFGINSPNPIVGRMIWTPAITPEAQEALSLYYANSPVATSNKMHVNMKSLAEMGEKAKSMITALLKFDSEIATVLVGLGQPEAALAVKAAGGIARMRSKKQKEKENKRTQSKPQPKKKKRTYAVV